MEIQGEGINADMSEKHYINATEYLHDNWKLAAMIRKSSWQPDFLVGLWRGGAPVAVAIHEFLKVTGWSVQHIPLKCASYTGIGENKGEVVFNFGQHKGKPVEQVLKETPQYLDWMLNRDFPENTKKVLHDIYTKMKLAGNGTIQIKK